MIKRKHRGVSATENIVRVAFNIIQMKVAAQHFETSIACHIACGSDMGDLGHGRKQFNEVMYAAEAVLDEEISKYLVNPLKSIMLPPHFYATADKATINRITNQAVMVCCMVDGKRRVSVSASEVYATPNNEESESEGKKVEISGAQAYQLANLMYNDVKKTYNLNTELMCG